MKFVWDKPAFFTWSIWSRIMRRRWCYTTTAAFIKPTNTFIDCCNRSTGSAICIFFTYTFASTSLSFRRSTTFLIFLCRLLIRMRSLNFSLSLYICLIIFKNSTFRNPLIPTVYITLMFITWNLIEIDNINGNLLLIPSSIMNKIFNLLFFSNGGF